MSQTVITDRESVESFLMEVKEVLRAGGKLFVIPREKNREFLLSLGLTYKNCRAEILKLEVEDYCSGPEPDDRDRQSVWIFGRKVLGKNVYIKLKLPKQAGVETRKKKVVCLSFHEAQWALKFVYQ